MQRRTLALAIVAALAGCSGGEERLLEDRDAGSSDAAPMQDSGPMPPPDAGDDDAGTMEDAGAPDAATDAGVDAGPPPPSCLEDDDSPTDPTAGAWDDGFSMPGVGGTISPEVNAIAVGGDDEVYVGGDFTHAGGIPSPGVAKWTAADGWEPLGAGIEAGVADLVVHPDGSPVYAAVQVARTEAEIRSFDGTSWSTVVGVMGGIADLEFDADGNLYAVGGFVGIGGADTAASVARYDGSSWSAVGSAPPDGPVLSVTTEGGSVCIGGLFDNIGAMEATNVACYEGGSWTSYGLPADSYQVYDVARDADGKLLAGGHFMLDPDSDATGGGIARWNDGRWELIGDGTHTIEGSSGRVESIEVVGGDIYVGGFINGVGPTDSIMPVDDVARWDGSAWHDVGGGVERQMGIGISEINLHAVVADESGDIYVGGLFSVAGDGNAAKIARWDGTSWSALGSPDQMTAGVNGNVFALAERGGCGVYVGGSFEYAGTIVANNVARVDDSGFHRLGDGVDGDVGALAVAPDGTVYAGGDFVGPTFYHLAAWDGSEWSPVGSNVMGPVTALTVDDEGNLYASGDFVVAGRVSASHIAMFDGSDWHPLGDGLDEPAEALEIDPDGDLVAGGDFKMAGGAEAEKVARWDGTEWSAYGDGLPGSRGVQAIAFKGDQLVVGGLFGELSDGGTGVAVWDGSSWSSLGGGVYVSGRFGSASVYGLATVGDYVFATGGFAVTDDAEEDDRAAYWDGSSWNALDGGLNDSSEAITATANGVWFGGGFTRAGDKPSSGLAMWRYATE